MAIILVLSYFGFDLEKFMNSDITTENLAYLKEFFYSIWENYIREYVNILYEHTRPIVDPTLEALKNPANMHKDFSTFNTSLPSINR